MCRSPRGNVDWNYAVEVVREAKKVVPHAGTWIEIYYWRDQHVPIWSFPTRERGLKYQHNVQPSPWYHVVPHAGTWIEIAINIVGSTRTNRRSPRGNVDWNLKRLKMPESLQCRSPRGNVDWNIIWCDWWDCKTRRSPRGNVDWNSSGCSWYNDTSVSFPTRERGLKWELKPWILKSCCRRSPRGNVDWN